MLNIVIATNADHESWAFGPFNTQEEAEDFAAKMASENPEIDYQVSNLIGRRDVP